MISVEEAKARLIEDAAEFNRKGWMSGTSGNLSIKTGDVPLRYVITASGRDKGKLTPADFVLVGEEGEVLEPVDGKSSAETMLHEAVYREDFAIGAVYHVHTVAATLLSMYGEEYIRFSGLEMLKGLGFSTHEADIAIPVIENTQDIRALGLELATHLEPDVPGFLLRGHGLYTWGKTPFEARRHVEIWDFLFEYKLKEWMLTRPFPAHAHTGPSSRPGS
jgi:methylthioribulose-1-phosphate dehydratase